MSQIAPYRAASPLAQPELRPPTASVADVHDVERLFAALLRRWRVFAAVAGGFVALVAIATILTPKSYTTTVRLLAGRSDTTATNPDSNASLPVLNALVLQSGAQSAETFAELAQQRNIASSVITSLNLPTTPRALLGGVSVRPVANTALLNLSVSWGSPDGSAQIANAFANAFVDQEREFVRAEAVAAIGFLSKELPNAEARMRDTASRLADFQSKHGYIDAATHEQDVVSRVASIDQRIDQLTVDQREAQALLNSASGQMASLSPTVDSAKEVDRNPVSSDLSSKLADVETQLAQAEEKYTPAHPAVIALRQQKAALEAEIASQPSAVVGQTTVAPNPIYQTLAQQATTYRARIQGDEAQIKELQNERRAYGSNVKTMPQEAVQFAAVSDEAKRAANVYNALAQKYSEALVAKTTAISDIVIVQPASADAAVKRPSLLMNVSIALAVGILLGLATIYVLDAIERRSAERNFSALLGLPVIARIPEFEAKSQRMIPWIQSMTVEAFLHLCVTLHHMNQRNTGTMAVLSARRGEGKSTVSYNLAKSLASLQPRVLLVDGDLRQPTIHEKANLTNTVGLSDVLEGTKSLGEAVQNVAPGLDVLTSGSDILNPVRLLRSRFETVLQDARAEYETVIVDTPALTAVSDGLLIAAQTDSALMVVSASGTDEYGARKAIDQLALFGIENVLGIVVNKEAATVSDYDDYFARMHNALAAGNA